LANQRLKHLLFGTVPVRAAISGGCRNWLIQLLAHMSLPTTYLVHLLVVWARSCSCCTRWSKHTLVDRGAMWFN